MIDKNGLCGAKCLWHRFRSSLSIWGRSCDRIMDLSMAEGCNSKMKLKVPLHLSCRNLQLLKDTPLSVRTGSRVCFFFSLSTKLTHISCWNAKPLRKSLADPQRTAPQTQRRISFLWPWAVRTCEVEKPRFAVRQRGVRNGVPLADTTASAWAALFKDW